MKYSQEEMQRLKRILFPRGHKLDLDETYESRSQFDKENIQQNTKDSKAISRRIFCRANLKSQMNKLHQDVELMLNSQQPSVDNVMNSTTRFYLQKIRQMSSCLEEQIVCLTQASENLISSLPSDHKILRNQGMDNIPIRLFVKIIDKIDLSSTRSLLRDAMMKIASYRRQPKMNYRNISRVLKLHSAIHRWRILIAQQKTKQKLTDCQQSINQLSSLLQHFLNEGHLVWSLTNLVRQQADYAQLLLYDRQNSRLYTYIEPTSTINSHFESMHSMYLKTGESDHVELRKFQLQLQESLTKICICNKQILKIERLEQDRDYSSCDVMITQQVDSFRPMSLGAVFMPLVNTAKEVVGVLRLYSIQSAPLQLDIRVTQFLGGIIEAVTGLALRIDEMKQQRKDERNQMYCKLLPIVQLVENSISTKQMLSSIHSLLKNVIFFQDMNIYFVEGNTCRPLYNSSNPTIYTTIKIMTQKSQNIMHVGNYKLMRFGSTMLQLKHPMVDIPYSAMQLLMRMIMSRVEKLQIKEKWEKQQEQRTTLIKIQKQKNINKVILKSACERLISCTTFDMVNKEYIRLLEQLTYVSHGQMFIRVDRQLVQMGTNKIHSQDDEIGRTLAKDRVNGSNMSLFNYELQNDDWTDVQQLNVERRLTQRVALVFSVAVPINYQKLIQQILDKFAQCVGRIIKQKKEQTLFKPILNWDSNLDSQNIARQLSDNLHRQCRIIPYEQLDGPLFYKVHRECAIEMPPKLLLPLQTESPQLQEHFNRIQKQASRQYLQELQQISRYFGKPIERVTLLCLTLNNNVIILAIDGHIETQPLLALQSIRKMVNFYEEQHQQHTIQKNITKFTILLSSFQQQIRKKMLNFVKHAYRMIKSFTTKPKRFYQFDCLQVVFKKTMIYSLSAIKQSIRWQQYLKSQIFNYENVEKVVRWHTNFQRAIICMAFSAMYKRSNKNRQNQRGVRSLFGCLSRTLQQTQHSSFSKIKVLQMKILDFTMLSNIIRKRLRQAFDKVKKSSEIVCDNRQSFVSTLVGVQGTFKEIMARMKEVQGVDLLLTGKRTISMLDDTKLILQCRGLTVVWTCKTGFMLTLEYKQYLQMLTKALIDRLIPVKQRMEPSINLMNMLRKKAIMATKHHFLKRWRSQVIKDCKKLEYSLIEKAYRLNQEMSTVAESRHRKRLQSKRRGQELAGAKRRTQQLTQLIQFEKAQIEKLQKEIALRSMMSKMSDVIILRKKMDSCWKKWRQHSKVRIDNSKKHQSAMIRGGIMVILRAIRKNKQNLILSAFQRLAVNLAKRRELQRQLSYNQSPINNPDYMSFIQECQKTGGRHLVVEQFDEKSKMTTLSKIQPIQVIRTSPKIKYISENIPPKKLLRTPRLSNSVNENIRDKIVEQGMRSRVSGAQTAVNYKPQPPHAPASSPISNPSAYKLNPNTINFLKKFGREALNQSDIIS